MLGCDKTVTLVHHEGLENEDVYVCTLLEGASLYKKNTIITSGEGARPYNTTEVRIMGTMDLPVALGDYIVIGAAENVKTPSDLAGRDKLRITSITDNRRGGLPHWRLGGQ